MSIITAGLATGLNLKRKKQTDRASEQCSSTPKKKEEKKKEKIGRSTSKFLINNVTFSKAEFLVSCFYIAIGQG